MADLKQTRFPIRGILIAVCLLGLFLIFAMPYFASTMAIQGEEFCPQLFQKREFSYWRIPGTKVRVSQTSLTPGVSPSSKDILQYLPAISQTDWQVTRVRQGAVAKDFGPTILIERLQTINADGVNFWDAWSFHNPKHAALLWPLVQQIAIKEMYFCIPELLANSEPGMDVKAFEKNLKRICLRAAKVKLKTLGDSKNTTNALQLRNWGQQLAKDFSDDPEIKELGAQLMD